MKRILVIEDTAEVLGFVRETIHYKGWQPLTASNGEEGLKIAIEQHPDLILCDVQMPRMNGYEVLEKLRREKGCTNIPFIFITGDGEKPNIRHGMELGADDYLVKPFSFSELVGAIEARLKKLEIITTQADEKLNQLRGSLTLALPHELVTPLNSILGFSNLLMQAEMPAEEVKECAGHIHASATRLHGIIESFIFYAQLEVAASDPVKAAAFRNQEICPACLCVRSATERIARTHKRESDLVFELDDIDVAISPSNLDRIVRELVDNAFKFSDPGQKVEVRVHVGERGMHLQVVDVGRGLTPEQLSRIGAHFQFDRRFYEQQGTGLGLAISERLAELHGGTLWIESTPGVRTIAHFQMPPAGNRS